VWLPKVLELVKVALEEASCAMQKKSEDVVVKMKSELRVIGSILIRVHNYRINSLLLYAVYRVPKLLMLQLTLYVSRERGKSPLSP
jgi:hypothetical protein